MNLQILCLVFPLVFTIAISGPVNKTSVAEKVNLVKSSEAPPVISTQTPALLAQTVSGETTSFPAPNPPYDTPTGNPVDPPITTSSTTTPTNGTTTTVVPPITTPNGTTTTVPPTTVKPTSTDKPTPTTVKPTPTTPNVTTTHAPVTTTALPPSKDRRFDGPSFIGGIILALGLVAIGFVSWKFYKARTERNYHTL